MITSKLTSKAAETLYLSTVTIAELLFGSAPFRTGSRKPD